MTQKMLLQADYLLRWGEELEIIPRGELVIEEDIISYSGPAQQRSEEAFTRVIKGENKLIMPGFINTHTHAAMSLFRGYADDMPLQEWLEQRIWPIEARLNKKDIYWGTLLALCEMIKVALLVLQICISYGRSGEKHTWKAVSGPPVTGAYRADAMAGMVSLQAKILFRLAWRRDGRSQPCWVPCSLYLSPGNIQKLPMQQHLTVPIHIHLTETRKEVEESMQEYGKRPVELMEQIGLLEQSSGCALFISQEEIQS